MVDLNLVIHEKGFILSLQVHVSYKVGIVKLYWIQENYDWAGWGLLFYVHAIIFENESACDGYIYTVYIHWYTSAWIILSVDHVNHDLSGKY